MMINNVNNHMPMIDVSHPFSSEEQDSNSQPPSVINNINHDITHPLLGMGSEYRSNSVSGGRPSVVNKTSINSMGIRYYFTDLISIFHIFFLSLFIFFLHFSNSFTG